jgi:hypothetical protein
MTEHKSKLDAYIRGVEARVGKWSEARREAFQESVEVIEGRRMPYNPTFTEATNPELCRLLNEARNHSPNPLPEPPKSGD